MIYVYRPTGSRGARELAEGIMLLGTVARRTRGRMLQGLRPEDRVVSWGAHFAASPTTKTLNNVPLINKYTEAVKLAEAGVATVKVSRTMPQVQSVRPAWVEPTLAIQGGSFAHDQLSTLYQNIYTFMNNRNTNRVAWERTPAVPAETWLGRRNNHVGGDDLLNPQGAPDYFSKKEAIVEEYRLHMFRGKSVRAGLKTPAPERVATPHAWIRSYDSGWTIRYDGFQSTKPMRKLARAALKALGLDFGAVDMGKKADGSLIVLEVNRAPGLENNTTKTYAKHIIDWAQNPDVAEEQEND